MSLRVYGKIHQQVQLILHPLSGHDIILHVGDGGEGMSWHLGSLIWGWSHSPSSYPYSFMDG